MHPYLRRQAESLRHRYQCSECGHDCGAREEDLEAHLAICHLVGYVPYRCQHCPGPTPTCMPTEAAIVHHYTSKHVGCTLNFVKTVDAEKEATLFELLTRSRATAIGPVAVGRVQTGSRGSASIPDRTTPVKKMRFNSMQSAVRIRILHDRPMPVTKSTDKRPRAAVPDGQRDVLRSAGQASAPLGRRRRAPARGVAPQQVPNSPTAAGLTQRRGLSPRAAIDTTRPRNTHPCSECHLCFSSAAYLRQHFDRCHGGDRPHSCRRCERAFAQSSKLKRHIKTVHEGVQGQHRCSDCQKTFGAPALLERHRRTHTGAKPYRCETCHKTFARFDTLEEHRRIHSAATPFCCEECGKLFKQSSHLHVHYKAHRGLKAFQCEQCGERFTRSGSLKKHVRTHTGEKPYECSSCGKRFTQSSSRIRHQRAVHGL